MFQPSLPTPINTDINYQNNHFTRYVELTQAINHTQVDLKCDGNSIPYNELGYSWSVDKVTWSDVVKWEDYNKVMKTFVGDYYLRIKIKGRFTDLYLLGVKVTCFTSFSCEPKFPDMVPTIDVKYDPYAGMDCVIHQWFNVSNHVSSMFGIPIYYFKVDHLRDMSKDVTFKEYFLHQVTGVKQIKMSVLNNTFPSARPTLDETTFGFDLEWEIEISKLFFAQAFGDTAYPAERDMIYVPMMRLMYQVNDAFEDKTFMYTSATWKLSLVAWAQKDNVDYTVAEIDKYVDKIYDDYFGPAQEQEIFTSGYTQTDSPRFVPNNLVDVYKSDLIRKSFTTHTVQFNDQDIYHRSVMLSKNQYKFLGVSEVGSSTIVYQNKFCGDEGTIGIILCSTWKIRDNIIIQPLITLDHFRIYIIGGYLIVNPNKTINDIYNLILTGEPLVEKNCWKLPYNNWTQVYIRFSHQIMSVNVDMYGYVMDQRRPQESYFNFDTPLVNQIDVWDDNWQVAQNSEIMLWGGNYLATNLRVWQRYLTIEESQREVNRYLVTDPTCIIADSARKFVAGNTGYSIT